MQIDTPTIIDESKIPLKRSLGLTTGILLVAGIIIGTGGKGRNSFGVIW